MKVLKHHIEHVAQSMDHKTGQTSRQKMYMKPSTGYRVQVTAYEQPVKILKRVLLTFHPALHRGVKKQDLQE